MRISCPVRGDTRAWCAHLVTVGKLTVVRCAHLVTDTNHAAPQPTPRKPRSRPRETPRSAGTATIRHSGLSASQCGSLGLQIPRRMRCRSYGLVGLQPRPSRIYDGSQRASGTANVTATCGLQGEVQRQAGRCGRLLARDPGQGRGPHASNGARRWLAGRRWEHRASSDRRRPERHGDRSRGAPATTGDSRILVFRQLI